MAVCIIDISATLCLSLIRVSLSGPHINVFNTSSVCMYACVYSYVIWIHTSLHTLCYSYITSLTYVLQFELRLGRKTSSSQPLLSSPNHVPSLVSPAGCTGMCSSNTYEELHTAWNFNVNPSSSLLSDLTAARSCFYLSQSFYRTYKNHRHCCNINWSCMCMLPILHQLSPALPLLPYSCICIWLKYRSPPLRALLRRVWKYNAADFEGAIEALWSGQLYLISSISDNVNQTWNIFKSIFLTTMST